ncbi:MAG: Holliday junction resolvase RuvX [Acholeplasmataceae bacterium]|nr:Holliday junction resolvase RuvX [Acholeplasmataceae bacterium]
MNKRYIGLDLGSKTLGISISESGIIASNHSTYKFEEDNYQLAVNYINDFINDNKIDVVVLGLPRHMNNDLGIRGEISLQFKELLSKINDCEIILWDERLSTKSALDVLIKGSVRRDKQKKIKDELAATIILQNYLDSINKN